MKQSTSVAASTIVAIVISLAVFIAAGLVGLWCYNHKYNHSKSLHSKDNHPVATVNYENINKKAVGLTEDDHGYLVPQKLEHFYETIKESNSTDHHYVNNDQKSQTTLVGCDNSYPSE